MGANHARVIGQLAGVELGVVVDQNLARARNLATRCGAQAAQDLQAVEWCDAVVVASSTETHAAVAERLIEAGRPLLVEKPITEDYTVTERLVECSRIRGVPLMCGFVERYNAAITTTRRLLDEPPVHMITLRHSPVNPLTTSSVVYDLLIHDVDLVLGLAANPAVERIVGDTWRPENGPRAEVADCTVRFAGGAVATMSASRAGQRKIRSLQVATCSSLYEIDLLRQDVTVYRHVHHAVLADDAPGYRAETIVDIPFVRHDGEPLALELARFRDLITSDRADIEAERDSILPAHRVVAALERP